MSGYKRLLSLLLVSITVISTVFAGSCGNEKKDDDVYGFAVCYIDVGEGDCIFVNFPDGKKMLIDSGTKSSRNYKKITSVLDGYGTRTIDYFIVTHPDGDHVGNAKDLLSNYDVSTAYIPYIKDSSLLIEFSAFESKLNEKGTKTKISKIFETVTGENYYLAFLSPKEENQPDSSYYIYNRTTEPTKIETNNLSPIIYLEYNGIRFVFTGDSGTAQEKLVIENNKLGIYSKRLGKGRVNLESVDFYKVSHHGDDDANSLEFISLLTPKNAVISVGGDNYYGHPSSGTLKNLITVNEECNILRTDVNGNITVLVDGNGNVTVQKEA